MTLRATGAEKSVIDSRSPTLEEERRQRIGAGRSGTVFLERQADGSLSACKVFGSSGLTKLVQWLFLGSPNPYMWNEDAVRCAVLRRNILVELVAVWFGDGLRVADASGFGWNARARALEMKTEFSPGRPAALHHPLRAHDGDEARWLRRDVLRPLQSFLIDAGFIGQVWQAGKGNPVALNNFLLEEAAGASAWCWIDLESGVPALPSLSPAALLGFYLPQAFSLGRPLFDDVATERLREHVLSAPDPSRRLGAERRRWLLDAVDELERCQRRWKAMSRLERGVEHRRCRGDISSEEAARYLKRPVEWYVRELARAIAAALRLQRRWLRSLVRRWRNLELTALGRGLARFVGSQHYRAELARRYVAERVESWTARGQMSRTDADQLRSQLDRQESSSYLTDFGIHVAIKPFVKSIEYWVFPTLFAVGWISGSTLAVAVLVGGALGRTLYTGGRLLQSILHGRERPWVALAVGVLPIFGNFAYPIQLLYSSTAEHDDLARFILYDGFTRVGRNVPIWGGSDSLTEHVFNRLPDRLPVLRHR